jgi:hypothetical protein
MRKSITLFLISLLVTAGLYSQTSKGLEDAGFDGFWQEKTVGGEGDTVVAIRELDADHYLIVAASTRDSRNLSFIADGVLDGDSLNVTTRDGVQWKFAMQINADGHESFLIMDKSGEYDVATCSRLIDPR